MGVKAYRLRVMVREETTADLPLGHFNSGLQLASEHLVLSSNLRVAHENGEMRLLVISWLENSHRPVVGLPLLPLWKDQVLLIWIKE